VCLIGVALGVRDDLPFVLAANRDEYFLRPTRGAHWWEDAPDVLAGRDLKAGGTWLGISRRGSVAAVTNIHRPAAAAGGPSRGELVAGFLREPISAEAYGARVIAQREVYSPFNLLLFSGTETQYLNGDGDRHVLQTGAHAISNAPIGDTWPKTELMRAGLYAAIREKSPRQALFDLLASGRQSTAPVDPRTDLFIRGEKFGTRSSTVILISKDGVAEFWERQYDSTARLEQEVAYSVRLGAFDGAS